jgi:hypothetical protein
VDSVETCGLRFGDGALLSGNIESQGGKTAGNVVPEVPFFCQLDVTLDDPFVVKNQASRRVSRRLGTMASKELGKIEVDPQASVVGRHMFIEGVVTGCHDRHVRSHKDAVDWVASHVPLVGGLVRPGMLRKDGFLEANFAHLVADGFCREFRKIVVGIHSQDDRAPCIPPAVDCCGEVLDEGFPWVGIAVGAAEVGFVLEPHCSVTVGWRIGSVRRDDHQVSMSLVSCSSL